MKNKAPLILAILTLLLPGLGIALLADSHEQAINMIKNLPFIYLPLILCLSSLSVGFALLPTHLLSLAMGYIYGLALGSGLAVLSITLGAIIAFFSASKLGAEQLHVLIQKSKYSKAADHLLNSSLKELTVTMFFLRLPPQLPFAMMNVFAAGLKVRFKAFVVGTLLGMAPRVIFVVWFGSLMSEWKLEEKPSGLFYSALFLAIIGFSALIFWSRRSLKKKGLI